MKIEIKKCISSITRYAAALAVGSVAATQGAHAQASPAIEKKSLKILGIGNSFLMNATNMLPAMVKDSGHDLVFGLARASSLQSHDEAGLLGETNPEDPKAKIYEYKNQKMNLKEMLTAENWDYVTIQQNSPNSFKVDTYRPHAQNLYDDIKKYAPQAEVVFHQTWAWRPDHNRQNMDKNPSGFMYQELTRNYHTIAKEVGIEKIIPVGNAFQLAEEAPEWKFARDPDFDYDNPKYPELPNESNSLNGGFTWRAPSGGGEDVEASASPGGDSDSADKVFKLDGSHANGAGMYLAACVWYEFFVTVQVG